MALNQRKGAEPQKQTKGAPCAVRSREQGGLLVECAETTFLFSLGSVAALPTEAWAQILGQILRFSDTHRNSYP